MRQYSEATQVCRGRHHVQQLHPGAVYASDGCFLYYTLDIYISTQQSLHDS